MLLLSTLAYRWPEMPDPSTVSVGAVTVMFVDALFPSLAAVIVTAPAAIAVTNPDALTLAFAGSLLDHVGCRSVSVLPDASLSVAVSCTVRPAASVATEPPIVIVETAGGAAPFGPMRAKYQTCPVKLPVG